MNFTSHYANKSIILNDFPDKIKCYTYLYQNSSGGYQTKVHVLFSYEQDFFQMISDKFLDKRLWISLKHDRLCETIGDFSAYIINEGFVINPEYRSNPF